MTFPQIRTGYSPMGLTSVWPYLSVKERSPLQSSGTNSALVVPNHTFSSCLCSGFPFSPCCNFLPSQYVWSAYCAPCEQWVMPVNWWNQSLRLTQPSVYTGNCGENLPRLSCSDTYVTVCIFWAYSRTLSQVTKPLSKCVRFVLTLTPAHTYICTYVCSLVHQSLHCFHNLCSSVCDPLRECHTDL